ncbi:hypothetical protein L207DRAFT_609733 [Hyaloscypha variabilis F]|uniref:Uncharacterized protein n=1 Tax=Hyaloscypha variabilis (strain UAMH 11265 / GT02V1 / F) TaxID=1149755 RepID=A0A2J6R1K9_HYAVF|nr:hypothetical protein L207DRAFT_609733 [Hyaloscypha variabilis F]
MVSIKAIYFAVIGLATGCLASPVLGTPEGAPVLKAEKRTSSPVTLAITSDGDCQNDNPFVFNGEIKPGTCTTFSSGGNYGALIDNNNIQDCVFKFWANADCSGQATTWFVDVGSDGSCVPLANQGGQFVLGPGAHSVLANCAEDAVPGSSIF